jgi:peptidoglycan/LPS O-acetylase OafA/YrhL
LSAIRNTQLDGWRAFAVVGVMCQHWIPPKYHGPFPFEIGLFFFLTLTGFLITKILLRERTVEESSGLHGWRWRTYLHFQKRRMVRILIPCYAAMLFAIAVGASDIREHWPAYFGHWSNFHMAWLDQWPSGTAHYWTLAIQMQFYLVWPLLVFGVPRRWLAGAFIACAALAPVSRMVLEQWFPEIRHGEAISTTALDYFGIGALLALAMDRGMAAGDKRLRNGAWLAFAAYAVLYLFGEAGRPVEGLRYLQQTLVAIAFVGLISSTLTGIGGLLGKLLEHPAVQYVGKLSFGLYLFHTPVPMFLGWVMPFLWGNFFNGYWQILRLGVFALTAWGFAWLCWRYLEHPFTGARKHAPSGPQGR